MLLGQGVHAFGLHLSQQRAAQKTLFCHHPPGIGVPTTFLGWMRAMSCFGLVQPLQCAGAGLSPAGTCKENAEDGAGANGAGQGAGSRGPAGSWAVASPLVIYFSSLLSPFGC